MSGSKKEIQVERIIKVGEFISGLRIKNKAPQDERLKDYFVLPVQRVINYLETGKYDFIINDNNYIVVKDSNVAQKKKSLMIK